MILGFQNPRELDAGWPTFVVVIVFVLLIFVVLPIFAFIGNKKEPNRASTDRSSTPPAPPTHVRILGVRPEDGKGTGRPSNPSKAEEGVGRDKRKPGVFFE